MELEHSEKRLQYRRGPNASLVAFSHELQKGTHSQRLNEQELGWFLDEEVSCWERVYSKKHLNIVGEEAFRTFFEALESPENESAYVRFLEQVEHVGFRACFLHGSDDLQELLRFQSWHLVTLDLSYNNFSMPPDFSDLRTSLASLQTLVLDYNPIVSIAYCNLHLLKELCALSLCFTEIYSIYETLRVVSKLEKLQTLQLTPFWDQKGEKEAEDEPRNEARICKRSRRRAPSFSRSYIYIGYHHDATEDCLMCERTGAYFMGWETMEKVGESCQERNSEAWSKFYPGRIVQKTWKYITQKESEIEFTEFEDIYNLPFVENFFDQHINCTGREDDFWLPEIWSLFRREWKVTPAATVGKSYRYYVIDQLKNLKVLDGNLIDDQERSRSSVESSGRYQRHACQKQPNAAGVRFLRNIFTLECHQRMGCHRNRRWIRDRCCGIFENINLSGRDGGMPYRGRWMHSTRYPRQLEYHPEMAGAAVVGDITGSLAIMNTVTNRVISRSEDYDSTGGAVLGLDWMRKYPCKFFAGSECGVVTLYDWDGMGEKLTVTTSYTEEGGQLSSLHVNSANDRIVTSGNGNIVRVRDIATQQLVDQLEAMSVEESHINVVKFSYHNPHLLATASFDKTTKLWDLREPRKPLYSKTSATGNVMVCFSPDDQYILSSATDNELHQYEIRGGCKESVRFHTTGRQCDRNYTRSYYMNHGRYVISGSCQEPYVHVYESHSGRLFRDVCVGSMWYSEFPDVYIQSLRGDPFHDFRALVIMNPILGHMASRVMEVDLLSQL